jgi:hypothetical protein
VHVQGTSSWVCVAAVVAGAPCGQQLAGAFCPNGHVCGSVNNGPFLCLPTCQAGKPCGKAGTCLAASASCSFCSSI